ncbi:MAG: hypothetical protein AAGF66_00040 [Cyanobacteria bacterium P01_H01_bin.119]
MQYHRKHCRTRIICNSLLLVTIAIATTYILDSVRLSTTDGTARYQRLQRLAWYGVVINGNR